MIIGLKYLTERPLPQGGLDLIAIGHLIVVPDNHLPLLIIEVGLVVG